MLVLCQFVRHGSAKATSGNSSLTYISLVFSYHSAGGTLCSTRQVRTPILFFNVKSVCTSTQKGDKTPQAFLSFLIAGRADPRGTNQRSLGFLPKYDTTNFESTVTVSIYAPRRFQVLSKTLLKRQGKPTFFHCSLSAGEQASKSPKSDSQAQSGQQT